MKNEAFDCEFLSIVHRCQFRASKFAWIYTHKVYLKIRIFLWSPRFSSRLKIWSRFRSPGLLVGTSAKFSAGNNREYHGDCRLMDFPSDMPTCRFYLTPSQPWARINLNDMRGGPRLPSLLVKSRNSYKDGRRRSAYLDRKYSSPRRWWKSALLVYVYIDS